MKGCQIVLVCAAVLAGCAVRDRVSVERAPVILVGGPGGGFAHPGSFTWTNGMTVKDAIELAGGLDASFVHRLTIWRRDGSRQKCYLPLTNNPALDPFDYVQSPCLFP